MIASTARNQTRFLPLVICKNKFLNIDRKFCNKTSIGSLTMCNPILNWIILLCEHLLGQDKFFSSIMNETFHILTIEQVLICFRSVDDYFKIAERFLGFHQTTSAINE